MTKTLKIIGFAYIKTIHKQFSFHFKYCFQLKQHYKIVFQKISMHTLWHVSKILFQKCANLFLTFPNLVILFHFQLHALQQSHVHSPRYNQ
jgi:hypothetical protein